MNNCILLTRRHGIKTVSEDINNTFHFVKSQSLYREMNFNKFSASPQFDLLIRILVENLT